MTIDTFAQNMLKGLREGKEINWDYVPNLVNEGKVQRNDAMSSLRGCLDIVIPEYRRMAKTVDVRDYWEQRSTKAETALKALNDGLTVKYRGIQL